MREAPEAPDHVAMTFRMLGRIATERRAERDGQVLIRQILGMAEGQVQEEPQLRLGRRAVAARLRQPREMARQRVGRVHMRRAAEAVARELVEQDRQRQAARRALRPAVQLPPRRREM